MFFLFRIISSQLFEVKASIFVYVGLFLCQRLFSLTLVHSSADKSNKLTNGFFFLKEERKKVIFSKVCLNQFFCFFPLLLRFVLIRLLYLLLLCLPFFLVKNVSTDWIFNSCCYASMFNLK